MSQPETFALSLGGMSCASCAGRVDNALTALEGVGDVSVNLASETVRFSIDGPHRMVEIAALLDKRGYPARRSEATLTVGSMSCASCVGRVEKALAGVTGVLDVTVNQATETATVVFLDGTTSAVDLARIATDAGYPARIADDGAQQDRAAEKEEEARALARLVKIAAALALPVFVLEMGGHLVPSLHHLIGRTIGHQASWLIQFVLTTAVLIGPGRGFYRKGLPALIKGAPDMNSLVSLGTGAAYLYSVIATFLPVLLPVQLRAVYFEAAAVIVVLILVGRLLEARAKGRTGAAIKALLGLRAPTARVERDGEISEVSADSLCVGDVIIVRPGESIPTDAEVVEGSGHIDESMITGEPIPMAKSVGDPVTGGTVNGAGSLRISATRVGKDTTLSQIIRMVKEAQGAKLPIQSLVDRITLWFVPAVMAVAGLTVVLWLAVGPSPAVTLALVAGVSVLIIACPCAMGLATPTSIMVGTGRAAELGVLFRKGSALQGLADVTIVALDKTGTVTEGQPTLTDLVLAEGYDRADVLARIAAVEALSEHPVAAAIVRAAQREGVARCDAMQFQSITGYGVRALVNGADILVGADRLMKREGIETGGLAKVELELARRGRTALYAAIDGRIAAVVGVADPVKASSRRAIAALRARGMKIAMITGDRQETAEEIAGETGIDHVIAGVLPGGKVAALDALRRDGAKLAFVGDGINDAPALAHADIGIAIGTGTDVAINAADVVLMSGDLRGVVNAQEVSRRTMANIRQNLFWAFGYNIALIPVAAGILYPAFGVLLSPVLAAGAMALSSVFVLSNALRLRRIAPVLNEAASRAQSHQTVQPVAAELGAQ